MDAILIHPSNKKQVTALKALFKAMDISFETVSMLGNPSPSNDPWWDISENREAVERGFEDVKAGRVTLMTKEKINEIMGL